MARRSRPTGLMTVVAPIVFLLICLGGWWATTAFTGIESWRLPSPGATWDRAVVMLAQASMWRRIATTAVEAVAGSAMGAVIALPLAYVIYRSRLVQAAVEPFLGATQALPAIALAPLLVLWIGYGMRSIAALCTLLVFFPILVSTVVGLRHLDREVLEAAELDGATGATMAMSIELPLAAPAILGGLRNGVTLSVTGAVVGEMVMGGDGLGQVLTQSRTNVDTAGMFVTIIVLCLMATIVYLAIYRIERSRRYDID
ncbi:ABC transporter permease [Actinomyces sp. B33]|uniref:ABC transporter permease n=1 Tax=Actinomyces sp. B33 TaxID=2942131 RepID=UPI0023427FD3|nr:ABC transporter permease [Actinomyces sp. B33]MDC4233317.1 ABC transporter permease [Actinomyces sp. B33]